MQKFKTQLADIVHSLLYGNVLSIKNGFEMFGCTNIPREMSRSVEQKFGVRLVRTPSKFKSRYGKSGIYYKYHLLNTALNREGIEKMRNYIEENKI